MANTITQQIEDLNFSAREFIKCIDSLPEPLFLNKIDDWTPRDVTAHLIGWNLYTIKGCHQLKKGELPFYFSDPGIDFCKVNAVLVREYNSKDKRKIIQQLDASTEELKEFLAAIIPREWETDFGVKYGGEIITIKNSVDALISDFVSHRQQIENWVNSRGRSEK